MSTKPYSISWHRTKPGLHSSEEQSGECGGFGTLQEAIRFASEAYKDWDGKGHPDFVGVWWEVTRTDEDGNVWTGFTTPRCT